MAKQKIDTGQLSRKIEQVTRCQIGEWFADDSIIIDLLERAGVEIENPNEVSDAVEQLVASGKFSLRLVTDRWFVGPKRQD